MDRGPRQWISRVQPAVDKWREGSRKELAEPVRLDGRFDAGSIAWLVQIAELLGDRRERQGETAWARELYLDFLQSAIHLRDKAPLDQACFACALEMRLASELRQWAFAKKTTAEEIRDAVQQLNHMWQAEIIPKQHFQSEYALLDLTQPRNPPTGNRVDRAESLGSSTPPPTDTPLTSSGAGSTVDHAIRIGLIWFWELADLPTAERTELLRELHQEDGTPVMRPSFDAEFCERYGLPEVNAVRQAFYAAEVQSQLARYVSAIDYMDQCRTVRAATRASLIATTFQKQRGYYPQTLATACDAFPIRIPCDPYARQTRPIGYIQSPGQRLRGQGLDWPRQRLRTRHGQPLIYSVGPDGSDDHGVSIWNRRLIGRGDWVFPLQPTKATRRWVQFDIRTMLAVFTLLGLIFGMRMSPPARHRAAIAAIEAIDGSVEYATTEDTEGFAERWLGKKFGSQVDSICLSSTTNLSRVRHLLPYLQEAKSLDASYTTLTAEDLLAIRRLTELETINLSSATLANDALGHLVSNEATLSPGLTKLQSIDISYTNANDRDLGILADCKLLTNIDASQTKITGSGFARLAGLPNLTQLGLIDSPIRDAHLAGIGSLVALEHLDLDSTPINGSGLIHLANLKRLETLDLRGTRIDDEGLQKLPALPALTSIYLQNCPIQGPGLSHLKRYPTLTSLSLCDIPLTDKGLSFLAELKSLEYLDLDGCQVTGTGLHFLFGLKNLATLDLSNNPILPNEFNKLVNALPKVEIAR